MGQAIDVAILNKMKRINSSNPHKKPTQPRVGMTITIQSKVIAAKTHKRLTQNESLALPLLQFTSRIPATIHNATAMTIKQPNTKTISIVLIINFAYINLPPLQLTKINVLVKKEISTQRAYKSKINYSLQEEKYTTTYWYSQKVNKKHRVLISPSIQNYL